MITEWSAPAKLTLSLRITGVRADGYHLLESEMVSLDLADTLLIDDDTDGTGGGVATQDEDLGVDVEWPAGMDGWRLPVRGQEGADVGDLQAGQASEHVGQVRLRIDPAPAATSLTIRDREPGPRT